MNATIKSLQIIREYSVVRPGQFAGLYFPRDHAGWSRSGKCGKNENGSQRGQGLFLWAGGWLAKLENKGLIRRPYEQPYVLTNEGERLLADARSQ